MGKDRSPRKMHLCLLLLTSPIYFAMLPQGFGVADLGFKGRKPWEGEGERKNMRKRAVSVRREGRERRRGWAGWALTPPKTPHFSFLIFLWYYILPSFKEFVPEFNHSKWEYEKILLKHPRYPTWHHHSRIRDHA